MASTLIVIINYCRFLYIWKQNEQQSVICAHCFLARESSSDTSCNATHGQTFKTLANLMTTKEHLALCFPYLLKAFFT